MSIKSIPVKEKDIRCELEKTTNQISFITGAITAICERTYSDLGMDELLGLQSILFNIIGTLRGVDDCFDENPHLLNPNSDKNSETPKQRVDAYLAQNP